MLNISVGQSQNLLSNIECIIIYEEICGFVPLAGCPGSNQTLLLLQSCGTVLPEVLSPERTELAHMIWDKMKELGMLDLLLFLSGAALCFSYSLWNETQCILAVFKG